MLASYSMTLSTQVIAAHFRKPMAGTTISLLKVPKYFSTPIWRAVTANVKGGIKNTDAILHHN